MNATGKKLDWHIIYEGTGSLSGNDWIEEVAYLGNERWLLKLYDDPAFSFEPEPPMEPEEKSTEELVAWVKEIDDVSNEDHRQLALYKASKLAGSSQCAQLLTPKNEKTVSGSKFLTEASPDHPIYKRGFFVGAMLSGTPTKKSVREDSKQKAGGCLVVTREQAYEIAKQDALDNELGFNINKVLLPEEITSSLPVLYGVPLENCWIAYVKTTEPLGLHSSTIIVVNRESGSVVYRGSANDEG